MAAALQGLTIVPDQGQYDAIHKGLRAARADSECNQVAFKPLKQLELVRSAIAALPCLPISPSPFTPGRLHDDLSLRHPRGALLRKSSGSAV